MFIKQMIGTFIGVYRITAKLGEGEVHREIEPEGDEAVKILPDSFSYYAECVAQGGTLIDRSLTASLRVARYPLRTPMNLPLRHKKIALHCATYRDLSREVSIPSASLDVAAV